MLRRLEMKLNLRNLEETQLGILSIEENNNKRISTIKNENISFTGKIPNWTRRQLTDWVTCHGGLYNNNVTKSSTTMLICGEGVYSVHANVHTSKITKAKQYGIKIVDYKAIFLSTNGKGNIGKYRTLTTST